MGNVQTTTSSSITNVCGVDPAGEPDYFHEVLSDDWHCENNAQGNMQSALSRVKVCKHDAIAVQGILRNEYFSSWNETCDVTEARRISTNNLDELISKVEMQYRGSHCNIRRKIEAIRWAPSWSHKIFEFSFGDKIDAGEVVFGMICIVKSPDGRTLDAICSRYKLDFTLAQEKVVTEETFNLFGFIPVETNTTVRYRQRNLEHFSKEQILNFCRLKALESFKNHGFINQVSFVNSLSVATK
ncbi:uncharacterized protein LOC114533689 [Dendronephthya gigantea]|uniref:uncharacterized protein LOC114533689 n=1 Tax=Dendronephthya gigantea TaxID=151771 RepID=UPI00106D2652|nr:uncharacterized protein LOC114533689 [Dendronephthya gigantea]